jgi:hypothetical protein
MGLYNTLQTFNEFVKNKKEQNYKKNSVRAARSKPGI